MTASDLPTRRPQDDDEALSWVAQERSLTGVPRTGFWIGAVALAAATIGVLIALGTLTEAPLPGEEAYQADGTVFGGIVDAFGADAVRILAALAAGSAVLATAVAVRALVHNGTAGIAAGLLVALDPAFLVYGHLAVPDPFLLAAGTGALALALDARPAMQWLAAAPMAIGALVDPWFLLWGVPLAAILLLRGHIYAAPKHLAASLAQVLGLPLLVAGPTYLVLRLLGDPMPGCPPLDRRDALLLKALPQYDGATLAVHDPALWAAGGLTLAGLALAALGLGLLRFRIARLPGRLQVRLPDRMPRLHGRSLWLLALAVFAPTPLLWLPLFMAALALGARQLGRDSPWFGLAVLGVLVAFALVYLVRFLPVILGTGDAGDVAAVLDALPWAETVACPGA